MIVLAGIVSILIFLILRLIITTIALTIYTLIVGFVQQRLCGHSDANMHFANQLLSAFLGILISAWIALMSFSLFDVTPNIYIVLPIYGVLWFFLSLIPNMGFKPRAQSIGAGLAFVLAYILF